MPGQFFRDYGIFCAAVLYGVGGSTILVTSLSITAELIGKQEAPSNRFFINLTGFLTNVKGFS